jgi:uncharacterized FlaG/YvyC family protein
MEMNSLYGVSQTTPVDPASKSREDADAQQAVIAAVRALNKSEFQGSGRELQFMRDNQTQKMVIQIVDSNSGDVLNQIPPEQVLLIMANFAKLANK